VIGAGCARTPGAGSYVLCRCRTPAGTDSDELPPGLIGAEVEWRTTRPAVMHRELAELFTQWQAAGTFRGASNPLGDDGLPENGSADAALRAAIVPLVRRIGYLSAIREFVPEGRTDTTRRGEPFEVWRDAVAEVGALVDLYDVWKAKNLDALDARLYWYPRGGKAPGMLVWLKGAGVNRSREVIAKVPSGLWEMAPDEDTAERRRYLRFQELHAIWQRDPFSLAYRLLAEELNRALWRGIRPSIPLVPPGRGKRRAAPLSSPVPLHRACLELWQELAEERAFRRCAQCRWWFDATKHRADARYCGSACIKAHARSRDLVPPQVCALPECGMKFSGVGQKEYCCREHRRRGYRQGVRVTAPRTLSAKPPST